jgi:hypothetical protein
LRALAASQRRKPPASHQVQVTASDDYPSWNIEIDAPVTCAAAGDCAPFRAVRFTSPATGRRPAPWFVVAASVLELEPEPVAQATSELASRLGLAD